MSDLTWVLDDGDDDLVCEADNPNVGFYRMSIESNSRWHERAMQHYDDIENLAIGARNFVFGVYWNEGEYQPLAVFTDVEAAKEHAETWYAARLSEQEQAE